MILSSILAVVIGLFFLWSVLSIATIQLQEWVNTRVDKRAHDLEDAIHEMLGNPNLTAQFYDHPVIRSLTAKKRREPSKVSRSLYNYPIIRGFTRERRKLPSYIPAPQFAVALLDIVMTAATESSLIHQGILKLRDDLLRSRNVSSSETAIAGLNLLAEIARSAAANEAGTGITKITLEILRKHIEEFCMEYPEYKPILDSALSEARIRKHEIDDVLRLQPVRRNENSELRKGVAALSVTSPELNQLLTTLLLGMDEVASSEEQQLRTARENLENWFDDTVDRVSGVFKRYSQALALIIGFYLALLLNIDAISVTTYLWREPLIREALLANAENFEFPQQEFASNPELAMEAFRAQFTGLDLPMGWAIEDQLSGIAFLDSNCQLFPDQAQKFGIPVLLSNKCLTTPEASGETNILLKMLGILFTALAARMGAPFWFDVLKKLVSLR